MKRLPDAEFEVMKAIWQLPAPVTATQVFAALEQGKEWKIQTVITLLSRLVERGFLATEKHGRDRSYIPLIGKEAYLQFETSNFIRQYHGNSFTSFISMLHGGKGITDAEAETIARWLQERKA